MSDEFTLIPVYNKEAINNSWPYYIKGVKEVLKKTNGDSSLAEIYNDILAGYLLLWAGFINERYCGFLTTKRIDVPFEKPWLQVVHLYINDPKNKSIFCSGFKEVEKHAKEMKCDTIRFWTTRDKSFNKKLIPMGWKLGYQEFVYPLKKEV